MSSVSQQEIKDDKENMNGDDDHLVDEILDELNGNEGTGNNEESTMPNSQGNMLQESMHQEPMHQEPMHQEPMHQEQNLPPMMDIEYNSSENSTTTIKNMLKKPLIVLCITFIVFNPLILNSVKNFIPNIIKNSIFYDQIQTLLLAVLVSILFLGTNYII